MLWVEAMEETAARFLAGVPGYIWDGESLPVPIEEIADSHLGLLVRDFDDLAAVLTPPELEPGQALSGLLLPDRGEIWVNAGEAREWPPRRRFTIAHEIGHWCLHRELSHPAYCRATTLIGEEREAQPPEEHPKIPPAEEEANAFAAAALMPAPLLREQYKACDRDFALLCERFASSGAAMGRRLHVVIPRG
jgi:hypothetical protein